MSVTENFVLHSLDLAGTQLVELANGNVSLNERELRAYSAGHHHPLFTSLRGQEPVIQCQTPQIKTLLDTVAQSGQDLSGGNTDFYLKSVTAYGTRGAIASLLHPRFRCANALAAWTEITVTHQEDALATVVVHPVWDGTNAPIVYAGSQAAVGTSAVAKRWTLGKVSINGTDIDGVKSVTISMGLSFIKSGSEGELYPSFVAVQSSAPVVSISGEELTAVWGLGSTGVALSSDLVVYLRDKAATGNVADGTASHISFTASNGVAHPQTTGAGGPNDVATTSYRVLVHAANSSSDPFTINTATAIS